MYYSSIFNKLSLVMAVGKCGLSDNMICKSYHGVLKEG